MALSKCGKVYTWGFSGKGLLGRERKIEEHLPLEIGFKPN
jgi:alpha-tubulin suppressor-like RCC1 family protein